jgi:phospholipase C
MQTRRDFLKLAAMLYGTRLSGLIPASIQRAYAIEPQPRSTWMDAEHVVILMQENRSFDHALGTLRGVRGFNDPRALRLANGNSVFVQTDAAGNSYAPWRLDIRDTRITWMGSLPHSRNSQVDAWNEGHHDRWIDAKRSGVPEYASLPLTMGHYTREDIPFYYALADAFTVCDQNYCSVMTSTTPNRSYFWTGTIRDKQSADSMVYMRNDEIERLGMTWKTFPERLQEAGISWKFYQNELANSGLPRFEETWLSNFGCNPLENFAAFNVEAYSGFIPAMQLNISELSEEAANVESTLAKEKDSPATLKLRQRLDQIHSGIQELEAKLPNSGEARYRQLSDREKALHHAAFVTNLDDPDYHTLQSLPFRDQDTSFALQVPKGDIFYQFRKDVNEGKLPAVSWLSSPEKFSDHPTSPWYGAWYISEVMDILTKNPEVWRKTIFILTYDENDGYFDHAPSFVAADPKRSETGGASVGIDTGLEYTYKEDELLQGVAENEARSGPIGMGFRVPMIIASPWSRGGWVNSQLFDHTSTLMFLERFVQGKYGKTVREENISAWRRVVSGDLTSVFRTYDPQESALDFLDRDRFLVSIEKARFKEVPSNFTKLTTDQIEQINRTPMHSEFTARQEEGIKPTCALPYELHADGKLAENGKYWELRLTAGNQVHGSISAGAPFNVYLRNTIRGNQNEPGMIASTYAVKPGDTITRQFPLSLFAHSKYSIDVHGPNGFYRSFTGAVAPAPSVEVRTSCERNSSGFTGNLIIHLRNTTKTLLSIVVTDNSYKTARKTTIVQPGKERVVVLPLKHSHGWYDFTVRSAGSESEVRYAGHLETGGSSFSDPLMGGIV